MPDEAGGIPEEEQIEPIETRYTAFEHWEYQQIIHVEEHDHWLVSYADSYYRAAEKIVDDVAAGKLFPEVEGIAGIFCFRHYLELVLKAILLGGRRLRTPDQNAFRQEVKAVGRIHDLVDLWDDILRDSKPKIATKDWENYDIAFVESCLKEFDERDKAGFAFRYHGQGGERYIYNFEILSLSMRHVHHVLDGIWTYLVETYHENAEWEAELRDIAGF